MQLKMWIQTCLSSYNCILDNFTKVHLWKWIPQDRCLLRTKEGVNSYVFDSFSLLCITLVLMVDVNRVSWCACRSGLLCDVTLKVGEVELSAHRNILSSGSQYFYAMFTGDLAESKSDCITLQEIDPKALSLLVDFIYTSEIQVTEENVQVSTYTS